MGSFATLGEPNFGAWVTTNFCVDVRNAEVVRNWNGAGDWS